MDGQVRSQLRSVAIAGGIEGRAAALQALLRAGQLDPDRVRLAAWLGDPAAQRREPFPDALPVRRELHPIATTREWEELRAWPRAVLCEWVPWSGHCYQAAFRLEDWSARLAALAPGLAFLAGRLEVEGLPAFVLPAVSPPLGVGGAGMLLWLSRGEVVAFAHPARVDDDAFVRTSVEAWSLGLPV